LSSVIFKLNDCVRSFVVTEAPSSQASDYHRSQIASYICSLYMQHCNPYRSFPRLFVEYLTCMIALHRPISDDILCKRTFVNSISKHRTVSLRHTSFLLQSVSKCSFDNVSCEQLSILSNYAHLRVLFLL